MNADHGRALELRIAALLHVGTCVASAMIGIGLVLPFGARIVTAGIALFIALPVLRVFTMTVDFLRRGDYPIALVAALVLAVIVLGITVSARIGVTAG